MLLLFDIDGTLLNGNGIGRRCVEAALSEALAIDGPALVEVMSDAELVRAHHENGICARPLCACTQNKAWRKSLGSGGISILWN